MYKKLAIVMLVLCLAGGASAAANWTNGTGDGLWSTVGNWDNPNGLPSSADSTNINHDSTGTTGPLFDATATQTIRNLSLLAQTGSVTMAMTGGDLTINYFLRLGAGGSTGFVALDMSGGSITAITNEGLIRVASGYAGYLNMSGDAQIIALAMTIDASKGFVDLRDNASIILAGDQSDMIEEEILAGGLTAWGGTGTIIYDNTTTYTVEGVGTFDTTTIWSIPQMMSPSMGEVVLAGDVILEWTNYDPNTPGDAVYVDVWFGTDPNKPDPTYLKVVDHAQATTVTVPAPDTGIYYWQVDSYIYGPTEPDTMIEGTVFYFSAQTDFPPEVDAGVDMVAWPQNTLDPNPVQLNATITDDGVSPVTILWEADDPSAVFSDPSIEDPTVTVDYPAGAVQLTITVTDEANPAVSDTMTIDVYSDACEAARIGLELAAENPEDLVADCIIDLSDFAAIAGKWLNDYALTVPVPVP